MRVGIIGGGIYGVTTAYFLERFGTDEVLLFERDHIAGGEGSTAYSTGIIAHHSLQRARVQMARRSNVILARVTELARELEMSKATLHHHLSTLEEREYVTKDGDAYHLGMRFFDFGEYTRRRTGLYDGNGS